MADVKTYRFVKNYFADPMVLVAAIKKYHEISKVPKGEYALLDLLRQGILLTKEKVILRDTVSQSGKGEI